MSTRKRILVSWISNQDFKGAASSFEDTAGPICALLKREKFDEIYLFSDREKEENKEYVQRLIIKLENLEVTIHPVTSEKSNDYRGFLDWICERTLREEGASPECHFFNEPNQSYINQVIRWLTKEIRWYDKEKANYPIMASCYQYGENNMFVIFFSKSKKYESIEIKKPTFYKDVSNESQNSCEPSTSTSESGSWDPKNKYRTRDEVVGALKRAGGNKTEAAKSLKLSKPTLYNRIDTYDIKEEEYQTE